MEIFMCMPFTGKKNSLFRKFLSCYDVWLHRRWGDGARRNAPFTFTLRIDKEKWLIKEYSNISKSSGLKTIIGYYIYLNI